MHPQHQMTRAPFTLALHPRRSDALASAASVFRLSSVTLKAHVLALVHCSNESLAAMSHVPTRLVIHAPQDGGRPWATIMTGLHATTHYLAVGHALCQTWSRLRELDVNMGDWPIGLELPQHYFPALACLKVKLRGDGEPGRSALHEVTVPGFYMQKGILLQKIACDVGD